MIKSTHILRFQFSSNSQKGILKGIKVLDLSRILVGPICSMQLSDLGAEVIKIEPFDGDETRRWGPPFVPSADGTLSKEQLGKIKQYIII